MRYVLYSKSIFSSFSFMMSVLKKRILRLVFFFFWNGCYKCLELTRLLEKGPFFGCTGHKTQNLPYVLMPSSPQVLMS